jgi:hypothetical protein
LLDRGNGFHTPGTSSNPLYVVKYNGTVACQPALFFGNNQSRRASNV